MIRFGSLDFGEEEKQAIKETISVKVPQLTMGPKVFQFEQSFAKWLGVKYAIMVNSGTSALMVALQAYNEVYSHGPLTTTALSYPADWNALRATSTPFEIQDIENDFVVHENMNNPKNHLAVHLLGKPCRVNAIIEDVAEALGSSINGKKLGSFGLLSCFSFYVAHCINTIEGGMVATNNNKLYDICKSLRDNGRVCTCSICTLKSAGICSKRHSSKTERRWEIGTSFGYNFKPTDIQGALGLVKMKHIDEICKRRNEIFLRYSEAFKNFKQEPHEYIVSIAYPLEVKEPQKTMAKLEKDGIECRGMFPSYSKMQSNAYRIEQSHILLPLQQEMTDKDVDYVIEKVKPCL